MHLNMTYATKMKVTHRLLGHISVDSKVYLLCEDTRQRQPLHLVAWRGRASRYLFSLTMRTLTCRTPQGEVLISEDAF